MNLDIMKKFDLEIFDEKSTSPSLEEHEMICPPLCEKVKLKRFLSIPCLMSLKPILDS
jgi:hypothetical protein